MRLGEYVVEGASYLAGFFLSLGPSQVFGIVKGALDLWKLASIQAKIAKYAADAKRLEEQKPNLQNKSVTCITQEATVALAKLAKWEGREHDKKRDLLADALALVPGFGAILSWRLYKSSTDTESVGLSAPGFEYSVPQVLGDHARLFAKRIFYPLSGEQGPRIRHTINEVSITVHDQEGARTLAADFYQHDPKMPRPTIILYHGNGMTKESMQAWSIFYYELGYDVLAATMGGYPGSPKANTSEATTAADVEAIKLFLKERKVVSIGHHGLSIGGTLAFQSAVHPSESGLEAKFVIADQTFTHASDVAKNAVINGGKPSLQRLAGGAARAACPEGRRVLVSKNIHIITDGLNNRAKAAVLKERNIPLFVISSKKDVLMGKGPISAEGNYSSNFAEELLKARYGEDFEKMKADHSIELAGGHCSCFAFDPRAASLVEVFVKQVMPLSL